MRSHPVLLTIRGRQQTDGEEGEWIELTTEGTMEQLEDHYVVRYEESELTGLSGVTTAFEVWPRRVILSRSGALNSRMEFVQGYLDQSLYDMGFGALLLEVRASRVEVQLDETGGSFRIDYRLTIDQTSSGRISYQIDVKPRTQKDT